jgi:hypothetical protein
MPIKLAASGSELKESLSQMSSLASGEAEFRLTRYFGTLIKPNPQVVTSPFAPGEAGETNDLIDFVLSCCEIDTLPDWLLEDEKEELKTFMPVSPLPSWSEWVPDVEAEWNEEVNFNPDPDLRRKAVESVLQALGGRTIRAVSLSKAAEQLDLTTNSGLPNFTRRSRVLDEELAMAERIMSKPSSRPMTPFVLGSRAKPDEEGPKRRAIYMAPMSHNILEKSLQIPVVPTLQKRQPWFASWQGPEAVDDALSRAQHLLVNDTEHVMASLDYSGFDRRVHNEKLLEVEAIISALFWETDRPLIREAFINVTDMDVVTPGGLIVSEGHRVKSGWGLTNLADSLIALVDAEYLYQRLGRSLVQQWSGTTAIQVNGDDVVIPLPVDISEEEIASIYSEHGAVLNPRKQQLSTELVRFNSRLHHIEEGRGVRSLIRMFRGLFWPERYHQLDKYQQALRAIMILHTVESHPKFEMTMDAVIQLDAKLGLGSFSEDVLGKILSSENVEHVSETLGIDRPGRLVATGATLRGLESWEVVNYLKRSS